MKNQRIIGLSTTIFLICFFELIGSQNVIQLRLPLRIFRDNKPLINLEMDDFRLQVNGKETGIVKLTRFKRSVSQKADLGRSFILSFQLDEYNQTITDGISHFITQNVNRNDILLIVSPLKFYQIQVTGNKGKMVQNIDELLKKDFLSYKKSRTSAEKSLLTKIQILKNALVKSSQRDFDITRYTTAIQFINNFPAEFLGFKKRFLFPDILKIRRIADHIASRGGDKWWIHFQQREVSSLFAKTKDIIKKLNWYETLADYNLGYKQGLSHLKKYLPFSHSFPLQDMINILLKNNISYHVVLFSGKKDMDLSDVQSEISDMEIIFSKISQQSGGKMVSIMTPEQGLIEIKNHWDFYFELGYDFNGQLEEKQIKINLKKENADLLYPDTFSMKEIKSLLRYHSLGKIKIGTIFSKENGVSFSVGFFKLHQKEKFGIIKVNIELFDEKDVMVYAKNNTLRAFKDKISFSIPFPQSYRGRYKMKIAVFDMIANHSDSAEHFLDF
jgi:hypothetical protein